MTTHTPGLEKHHSLELSQPTRAHRHLCVRNCRKESSHGVCRASGPISLILRGVKAVWGEWDTPKTLVWVFPRECPEQGTWYRVQGTLVSQREAPKLGYIKVLIKINNSLYGTDGCRGLRSPEIISLRAPARKMQQNFVKSVFSTDKLKEVGRLSFYTLNGLLGRLEKACDYRSQRWADMLLYKDSQTCLE